MNKDDPVSDLILDVSGLKHPVPVVRAKKQWIKLRMVRYCMY
ncbi:MAG: hypothetical protein OEW89_11290 [Gammaproteobacteria bacterium]|nr:hypothetical protein [Gammaproteobacteria bacterium]MDH5593604.1 hypothetical protein [Gammaproteobacteria bacterium]MDH5613603.1 hypothetical protein [Gammaproteobacteria bacterium]